MHPIAAVLFLVCWTLFLWVCLATALTAVDDRPPRWGKFVLGGAGAAFVVLLPVLAYAAPAAPAPSGLRSELDDVIAKVTAAAVAALVAAGVGLAGRAWRWMASNNRVKQATRVLKESEAGRALAKMATDAAEQLYRAGKLASARRLPYAMESLRRLGKKAHAPDWVIEEAEHVIEAELGVANAGKPMPRTHAAPPLPPPPSGPRPVSGEVG